MLTFFKINCPWDGHVGGGELSEIIGSFLGRFVYWRILSTQVISDTDSRNCFMVYCTQTIRINDDIARPAGYIACSIKNKENLQLFEEWEKESYAEIYKDWN